MTLASLPPHPIPPPAPGTRSVRLPAPGKINRFLHIVGRRADGYHLLQSHFLLIDWCDWITLTRRDDGIIEREPIRWLSPLDSSPSLLPSNEDPIPPAADLTLRAAHLLRSRYGNPALGVTIRLEKSLPIGGGVGGGSSDAATTLYGLNCLWELHRSREELIALACELGADIPFFLFGENALVEGIGEQLTPWPFPSRRLWLFYPSVSVPTGRIFADPLLTRDTPCRTIEELRDAPLRNDLEPVVCRLYPQVEEAIKWLRKFGEAKMSGAGAVVFLFDPPEEDPPVPPYGRLREGKTIVRHPLWSWAEPVYLGSRQAG